jgi:FkbM family methyltransferase
VDQGFKRLVRSLFPTKVSPHRVLGGPLRGARIVTSWHDYPAAILGKTERELLGWFQQNVKAGETWLDVGAHYGYTALALCRLVGPSGRVFAFEPMLRTAASVTETRRVNAAQQLTVIPMGLGAPEQDLAGIELPVERGMADSTIRNNGWSEALLVTSLDWLWPRISGPNARIHGVKIDVQGMEIHALRGMLETLRANRPRLVVELHHGVDRQEFRNVLREAGYPTDGVPLEHEARAAEYLDNCSYAFQPEVEKAARVYSQV